MLEDRLSRFENQIQRLVEGGFARLFAGRLHPREVAVQLARAMEDHLRQTGDGQLFAPDIYTVRLNPLDHTAILATGADVVLELSEELVEMARATGLTLIRTPEVRLLADLQVDPHHVAVTAQHASSHVDTTQAMPAGKVREASSPQAPEAFLLVENGKRQIPLNKPIVNIGRHRDNDVILDDPTISRHHAQLRLRFGHYVMFDLGSSGGTTVNGESVGERILQSGDVIGLSGCSIIYVEDAPPDSRSGPDSSDTQTYKPVQT
jgi:hypothetical protein